LAVLFVVLGVAVGLGVAPLLSEPTQTDSPIVVHDIQRLNELATVKWTHQ
jgi:hypothetical protein